MKKFIDNVPQPEDKFPCEAIKQLISENEIKVYMENLRIVKNYDSYIPVRSGMKCPAEILANMRKKRINAFSFNHETKELNLMKAMGDEGEIINILFDKNHFIRLYNSSEGERHKLQCNQIYKNYLTSLYY